MELTALSGSQFPKAVSPLVENARESIDIIVFDWRWYPHDPGASCQLFNQSIIRAAQRKLKIRAVLNNDNIISILKSNGIEAKRLITAKLVHCKFMIIDSKHVVVGSHNYSESAFCKNLEFSVIIKDVEDISSFNDFFNRVWS